MSKELSEEIKNIIIEEAGGTFRGTFMNTFRIFRNCCKGYPLGSRSNK